MKAASGKKDAASDGLRAAGEENSIYHNSWLSGELELFAKFIDYRGRTPKKTSSGIPLITAKNIRDGFINREPREFIAESDYDSWMTRGIPQVGDVIVTTEAPMGNVANININEKFALAQRSICLQFYKQEMGYYAKYALRSPQFQNLLVSNSTGTTVQGIKAGTLKKLGFPLPPLAEQKVIAEKLDTLLAQVDNIQTRLDAIPTIIKRFRQSVLSAAVSGKLTEEWRVGNSLYNLDLYKSEIEAARIKKHSYLQSEATRKSRYKEPVDALDTSFSYPKTWLQTSLDAITYRITYGLTVRPRYVEDGVPIISAKEIRSGQVDYQGAKKFAFNEFGSQREKCKIYKNDVLFSKTGSIGHVAKVGKDIPLCSSQNIAVLSPLINADFLELLMRSPYMQELAAKNVKANAIPDLQLGVLARFPVSLLRSMFKHYSIRKSCE